MRENEVDQARRLAAETKVLEDRMAAEEEADRQTQRTIEQLSEPSARPSDHRIAALESKIAQLKKTAAEAKTARDRREAVGVAISVDAEAAVGEECSTDGGVAVEDGRCLEEKWCSKIKTMYSQGAQATKVGSAAAQVQAAKAAAQVQAAKAAGRAKAAARMDAAAKVKATQQSHKTGKLEVPARETDNSKAREERDEQAQKGTLQTRAAEQVKQAIAQAKAHRASIRQERASRLRAVLLVDYGYGVAQAFSFNVWCQLCKAPRAHFRPISALKLSRPTTPSTVSSAASVDATQRGPPRTEMVRVQQTLNSKLLEGRRSFRLTGLILQMDSRISEAVQTGFGQWKNISQCTARERRHYKARASEALHQQQQQHLEEQEQERMTSEAVSQSKKEAAGARHRRRESLAAEAVAAQQRAEAAKVAENEATNKQRVRKEEMTRGYVQAEETEAAIRAKCIAQARQASVARQQARKAAQDRVGTEANREAEAREQARQAAADRVNQTADRAYSSWTQNNTDCPRNWRHSAQMPVSLLPSCC